MPKLKQNHEPRRARRKNKMQASWYMKNVSVKLLIFIWEHLSKSASLLNSNWLITAKYAKNLKKQKPAFHSYIKVIPVLYFFTLRSLRLCGELESCSICNEGCLPWRHKRCRILPTTITVTRHNEAGFSQFHKGESNQRNCEEDYCDHYGLIRHSKDLQS